MEVAFIHHKDLFVYLIVYIQDRKYDYQLLLAHDQPFLPILNFFL
jgi:hypothetical protein